MKYETCGRLSMLLSVNRANRPKREKKYTVFSMLYIPPVQELDHLLANILGRKICQIMKLLRLCLNLDFKHTPFVWFLKQLSWIIEYFNHNR